ncbi:MAG TPA: hypothetical protein DE117_05250 [Fervidobacterium sp.]|nr:hypothetical protein [Fervidobacterium sp.]
MKQVKTLFMNFAPSVATISLWASYIVYDEALIAAILMSLYTAILYFSKSNSSFDGVIEITETEEGGKSFQLVINKDPETFQDQDQVIFHFKEVS